MKKIFTLLLAGIMVLSLAACGTDSPGSTLVYGSGDYDSINPIMNEHCEIKHLLFDSLVKRDDEGYWCRNGERISFTINAAPGDHIRIDMAQIAAQQLQEIGLDVKANVPAEGIDWGGQECCIISWG